MSTIFLLGSRGFFFAAARIAASALFCCVAGVCTQE